MAAKEHLQKIHTVRVRSIREDPKGKGVLQVARETLGVLGLTGVETADVYRLGGANKKGAHVLAERLLTDPVTQEFTLDERPPSKGGDSANPILVIEIGKNPGVMDEAAGSVKKAGRDLGINLAEVATSTQYHLKGQISPSDVEKIVREWANPTVEREITKEPETLRISGKPGETRTVPILNATPEDLEALSKDKLFLNAQEMQVIQDYFKGLGRNPTDIELEIIAARWSEHCGHKTFNARLIVDGVEKPPLFKRIKDTARKHFRDLVRSAFEDNSGVIQFGEDEKGEMQNVCGKVETHNSPSAVEPYGGAGTGTGGVIRDILGTGLGGKIIASTDIFCFADPDLDSKKLPLGTLNPKYLYRRVIQGVRDYGNRMGIPTNNGSVHFHEDFRAKPSVIVGSYGIIPDERSEKGQAEVNDLVVVIGGRTGRDGIHGATFSSGEMTDRTINVNSSAVQIGNAIEEKRMVDAVLEARDKNLIRAITDCGAAGLSSAIGEMGEGTGVTVDIAKAPLKYQGMAPWEIWLSESQERMALAVDPKKIKKLLSICRKHSVEATVLGTFDGSNRLTVKYGDQTVADLDYKFLKNLPQRTMLAHYEKEVREEPELEIPTDWVDTLKRVMSHGNVASKEPIVRQYDHSVQGTSVMPPFGGVKYDGPNDAVVIRPIRRKPYGMVIAHGMNPVLNKIDPYWGSVWACAEAASNYIAAGGDPDHAAFINNWIWPFPTEEQMGALDKSVDAVCDSMNALEIPVVSGKDSLSSTYRGKDGEVIEIPPALCMSVFGKVDDIQQTVTTDIKKPGSSVYLVGAMDENLGGSTYYDINGTLGNEVPKVDLEILPKTLRGVHRAIQSGDVLSCHDVSEGGVIATVSEMAFGGDCGVKLQLDEQIERPDMFLFNETAGTFVIEVSDAETAERLFKNLPHMALGKTTQDKTIGVKVGEKELFSVQTDELKKAWQKPMRKIFP